MQPSYDEFDEIDLDFADSAIAKEILRGELHEQRRLASRRAQALGKKRKHAEDEDDFADLDFDEDYDDYDDEDTDSYSERDWD